MNKYREEILGSVSTERLRGFPHLRKSPWKIVLLVFFPFLLRVSCPTPDLNVRESCSVGQNACFEQKKTPRVTPLRSCDPHIQTLQPHMKVLLWSQVSDLSHFSAPVSPQKSPAASQRWGRCVKTARRSARKRLCETRARCPLHKVPRFLFRGAHISDVLLFLRREERGRGVRVPQNGRGAFLERDPAEDSGWHLPF